MENILVTTQAVAAVDTAVDVALAGMTVGDLIIVADGKGVVGAGQTVPSGTKEVMFFTKLNTGEIRNTVSIPLDQITHINHQNSVAGVNRVLTTPTLVIPSIGEGNITLKNLSYNHTISTQRIVFSLTKKSTETAEAYIDRVVAGLNAAMALQSTPFCVVSKVTAGLDFSLRFTSSNTDVDLFVGVDGIFADFAPTVTTDAVAPIGAGKDVYNMEVDMSRHLGNGGYVENTDLWFKVKPQANIAERYFISTINWRGIVSTPQSTKVVAQNSLAIACIDGNQTEQVAMLNSLVTTIGVIVQDEDFDATDHTNDENPTAPAP